MADLGVIAYLALPGRAKWTKALVVAVGIIIGLLAQSAGALGYLIAIVVLYMWSSTLTWRPTQRKVAIVASATLAVAIIFVASQNIASETAMIGKDSTLTGRTDLWKLSLRAVEERPLWGYGYGAFWGKNSPRARPIREEVNWGAPHAHDGYIDLALELGFVGILIYAIMMFTMMKRAYRAYVQTGNSVTQWPLLYLVFISLYQLTESSIITGDYILWILLCSLACYPAEACASRAHEVVTESPSNARLLLA
jgi:O-antigen ligase